MSTTLLLADVEHAAGSQLERHLRDDGFEIVSAPSAEGRRPDLVLAAGDAALGRWCGEAPVIVLGRAEADLVDRVRAFRQGCDGYERTASLGRSSTVGGRVGPASCAAA